jgi:hypothetical protein
VAYLVYISHQIIVLGDRQGDAGDIRLLEGVIADEPADDLSGDKNDRRGIHAGCGNAGHKVGGART